MLASIDGGAFNQVASFTLTSTSNAGEALTPATPLTASGRADFHVVATSNTAVSQATIGGSGTFRINNYQLSTANTPFTISGTIAQATTAVPEPAAWTMMIVGVGLAGAALRRRGASAGRFA